MLLSTLVHLQALEALASVGHGSRLLIADGNCPFSTTSAPSTQIFDLKLAPGMVSVSDVLRVLITVVPIEEATVRDSSSAPEPPILGEFRLLMPDLELEKLERFAVYEAVRSPETALIIATGEQRTYANILLTIGVVS